MEQLSQQILNVVVDGVLLIQSCFHYLLLLLQFFQSFQDKRGDTRVRLLPLIQNIIACVCSFFCSYTCCLFSVNFCFCFSFSSTRNSSNLLCSFYNPFLFFQSSLLFYFSPGLLFSLSPASLVKSLQTYSERPFSLKASEVVHLITLF